MRSKITNIRTADRLKSEDQEKLEHMRQKEAENLGYFFPKQAIVLYIVLPVVTFFVPEKR